MPGWLISLSIALLTIVFLRALTVVGLAARFHRSRSWETGDPTAASPSVSVLVPAFNEEKTIRNCLYGLSKQQFRNIEVIVIDDGSTDQTGAEVDAARDLFDESVALTLLHQENAGKASALNHGILAASGEIVVCVDADSVLVPDAIEQIVRPFADESVGAVAGMVKIANPKGFLRRQQAMEYISGLMLQRAAFAQLGSVPVMSGAISAFRRTTLQAIGGYSEDTIVEDFDVTVAVHATGSSVIMHPHAVAHTEGPGSIGDLRKQRRRWVFGGFQVLGKYRDVLFSRALGRLSILALPYVLVFPWIDVLISALLAATLSLAVAAGELTSFLLTFTVLSMITAAMNLYALRLSGDSKALVIDGFIAPLFYAHLLTLTTVQAGWRYLRQRDAGWDPLTRTGDNVLDEHPAEDTTSKLVALT